MKKAVVLLALFLFTVFGAGWARVTAATKPVPPETTAVTTAIGSTPAGEVPYTGAIDGNLSIHMRLTINEGKVTGSYYYDNIKTDIVLKGKVDGSQIRIDEYDDDGKVVGCFYGAFVAPGRIEGVWTVFNPEREGHFRDLWLKIYPFFVEEDGSERKGASSDLNSYKEAWEGTWRRPVSTGSTYGEVRVSFATDKSFWFETFQFAGANSRQIRGVAALAGEDAIFRNGRGDELRFLRKDGQLYLQTNEKFSYNGAGVVFDGEFTRGETRRRTLAEIGILSSAGQEDFFRKLTGSYYERFVDYFHMGGQMKSLDGTGVKAFFGWVRGVAPYYQGLVMRSEDGVIWAALLTFVERQDVIVYFASDGNTGGPIPKTIESWIDTIQKDRKRKLEVIRYYND